MAELLAPVDLRRALFYALTLGLLFRPLDVLGLLDVYKRQVVAGDTLSRIAAKYGTTVAKLAADNGIKNPNLIHVGQVITINK